MSFQLIVQIPSRCYTARGARLVHIAVTLVLTAVAPYSLLSQSRSAIATFKRGSSIHEHSHRQEEVYNVIEGELEITIGGVTQVARTGIAAIVPSNVLHSVKALTDGRAIIVDYTLRRDFE
jgi:Uncharacterized conserved protein, contains double-stranded beta-helix domain